MTRNRGLLLITLVAVLLVVLIGSAPPPRAEAARSYLPASAGQAVPASNPSAPAPLTPLAPAGLPPKAVNWLPVGLVGGPLYALGVSDLSKGGQTVFAGGHEVFTNLGGDASWALTPARTGEIANLAVGPDGVVYAASPDGRGWRTTSSGRNWLSTRLRGDAPVAFLAVSPNYKRDQLTYGITTGDWRLYRSEPGGSVWSEVVIELGANPKYEFGAVAFSPLYATDGTLFVGCDRGVYKSVNSGLDWTLQASPAAGAPAFGAAGGSPSSQGIVVPWEYGDDPNRMFDQDIRALFAYNASGVYRSDDDGVHWQRLPLQAKRVRGLAVSNGWPTDPVLLAAIEGTNGEIGALSKDSGAQWQLIPGRDGLVGTTAAMAHDFAYIPPEVNPDERYVFMPVLLRNAEIGGPLPPPLPVPRPYLGSREMYLATDGDGIWRSPDAGQTWDRRSTRLYNAQPTSLAFLPGGPDAPVLAGTDTSGLHRSSDGGRTWRWLDAGLPRGTGQAINVLRVSPDFARDQTIFLAAASGVWRSTDGGATWHRTTGPAPAPSLDVSPAYARDRTVAAAGQLSTDGGDTWTPLPVTDPWTVVAFSPQYDSADPEHTDRKIWSGALLPAVGQGYMLRTSIDNGQTWTEVKHASLRNRSILALSVLSVTTDEANRVFAGTDRGLVVSHDGGATWTQNSDMSTAVGDVASRGFADPHTGMTGIVLAVGETGALWSVNRGISWIKVPDAPDGGRAAAISADGSVLLDGVPIAVARYGEGSARIFAPRVLKGE
jgi:photosystem II stability/assembly factor-like uncharacterized protein